MDIKAKRILLVEDEEQLSALLSDYLKASGFEIATQYEGIGVVEKVQKTPFDLILLDLMLPGIDGIEICKQIRAFSQIPIIMVTARVEEIDRLLGLELGADDYICKPFSPREVVARVKAVLRRSASSQQAKAEKVTGLLLDEDRYLAVYNEIQLDLTPVEFRLLQTLAEQPGRVFSRDQLMNLIYNDQRIVTDRTVDTHIKNLRKKLMPGLNSGELIHSVYGVGYKLEYAG